MVNASFSIALLGLLCSLFSVIVAFCALKREQKLDQKREGKKEGTIISDIGYIKACVDRVEKSLSKVDESYKSVLERLAKSEEAVAQITKRVDEVYKKRIEVA